MIKRFLTFGLGLGVSSMILLSTTNFLVADSSKMVLPPSWTVTRCTYDISVEELAQKYYGDSQDYRLILEANKKLLRGRHTVPKNTEIKIPVTDKFRDQPEKLGWN